MSQRAPDQRASREATDSAATCRGRHASPWRLLLLVPLIGTLVPSFYNQRTPVLAGVPFFYWYQMLWVIVSAVVTAVVYLATDA